MQIIFYTVANKYCTQDKIAGSNSVLKKEEIDFQKINYGTSVQLRCLLASQLLLKERWQLQPGEPFNKYILCVIGTLS